MPRLTLQDFAEKLGEIIPNTGHFKAKRAGFPRLIFGETTRRYFYADNRVAYVRWVVEVHLFTKTHFDPIVDELESMFTDNGISYDMVGVEYGDTIMDGKSLEKGVIYYLYECEV
jgi:hypothetical protein